MSSGERCAREAARVARRSLPRLRRAALWFCVAGFGGSACRAPDDRASDWPPSDFYLEVRARTQTKERLLERQSLHVFADGLVVYRAVDEVDAFPQQWPPVFSRLSAYRLLPQSIRSLARDLYRAGAFQSDTVVGTDFDAEQVVVTRLRGFGDDRRSVARGRVYGSFVDILHAVNAYLPPGCAIELPDMTGEPQPPRLSRVPAPVRSLSGAYGFHRHWSQRFAAADVQWQIEYFALAARAGDFTTARAILTELEEERARQVEAFPDREGTGDPLRGLRALLPTDAER